MEYEEDTIEEKRGYPRVKNLYLVSYIHKEAGRQIAPVSMGRTLDISPSGVRLEVFQQIKAESEMEMEIALEDSQVSVRGMVLRALETGDDVYVLGIRFNEVCAELNNFIRTKKGVIL